MLLAAHPQLVYLLWFVSTLFQATVLVLLLKRRMQKDFPYFVHFTVFQVLTNVLLYGVDKLLPYAVYFYAYWAISAVSYLLSFAIIYEVFQHAFKPYMALRDFAAILFRWATLVLILVAAVLAFSAPVGESHLIAGVFSLERSVMVMQAGMLLFLMMFSSQLGLTWKHHSFGIMTGFGLYACGMLIVGTLRSEIGVSFSHAATTLESVLYAAMVSIWLVYLATPEPARVAVQNAFAPKPVLNRWNDVLSSPEPGDQGAFLMSLERIVDHVLEEKR